MDDAPAGLRSRTAAQLTGEAAEQLVADRLIAAGWTILGRNVRVGRHEIDLVAIDVGPPRCLVIVEVRWRRRRDFGFAEETVDHRKRGHLRHAASALLDGAPLPDGTIVPRHPLRFDLVAVEPGQRDGEPRLRHHRSAF